MADPKITIKITGGDLPSGGKDGQVLTRRDGKAVWADAPEGLTAEAVFDLMIDMGIAPVLLEPDGSVLADGDGAILIHG